MDGNKKVKKAAEEESIRCSKCSQQIVGSMLISKKDRVSYYAHKWCSDYLDKTLDVRGAGPKKKFTCKEFANDGGSTKCSACTKQLLTGQIYFIYIDPNFHVEFKCFAATNSFLTETAGEGIGMPKITRCRAHEHPLEFFYVNDQGELCCSSTDKGVKQHQQLLAHNTNAKNLSCATCLLPLSNQVYCCPPCNFWVHKPCFSDLERWEEVVKDHPFHPQAALMDDQLEPESELEPKPDLELPTHVLKLHEYPPYPNGKFKCDACGRRHTGGIVFYCDDCGFCLDAYCALHWARDIKCDESKLCDSRHELYLFKDTGILFPCKVCNDLIDSQPIYRCVPCNYNIHAQCIGSPPKHPDAKKVSANTVEAAGVPNAQCKTNDEKRARHEKIHAKTRELAAYTRLLKLMELGEKIKAGENSGSTTMTSENSGPTNYKWST